jgi:hypothetical protein
MEHNLEHNPLFTKYKTAVETTPGSYGVPVIGSGAIDGILAASRARGPNMPAGQSESASRGAQDADADSGETDEDEVRHRVVSCLGQQCTTCALIPHTG